MYSSEKSRNNRQNNDNTKDENPSPSRQTEKSNSDKENDDSKDKGPGSSGTTSARDKKKYQCHICSKQYPIRQSLRYHIKHTHNEKNYVCETCEKEFSTETKLEIHQRLHSNVHPYECKTCKKKFTVKRYLRQHSLIHKNELHKCPYCKKEFQRKSNMRKHIKTTHMSEKNEICEECNRCYTKCNLRRHYKRMHPKKKLYLHDREKFQLEIKDLQKERELPESYKNTGGPQLVLDLKSHKSDESCEYSQESKRDQIFGPQCNVGLQYYVENELKIEEQAPQASTSSVKLVKVQETLTQLSYECLQHRCAATFSQEKDWQEHIKLHTDGHKYRCGECGDRFNQKEDLKEHKGMKHFKENTYKCRRCSKRFGLKEDFKRHIKSCKHPGKHEFQCELCKKTFELKLELLEHMPEHQYDRNLKCKSCDTYFNKYNEWYRHKCPNKKNIAMKKPFKCWCSQRFKHEENFEIHLLDCQSRPNFNVSDESD